LHGTISSYSRYKTFSNYGLSLEFVQIDAIITPSPKLVGIIEVYCLLKAESLQADEISFTFCSVEVPE